MNLIYAAKIAKIKVPNIQRIIMNKILSYSISKKIVKIEICDFIIKKDTNLPVYLKEYEYKFVFKIDINNVVSDEVSDLNNENKEIFIIQNEKGF